MPGSSLVRACCAVGPRPAGLYEFAIETVFWSTVKTERCVKVSPLSSVSSSTWLLQRLVPGRRCHRTGALAAPPRSCSRKEVFQPHLPVRLPCYDLAPVTGFTLGRSLRSRTSGTPGSHGLTGGVYKARERIHRAVADARLLANPASWSRVADSNPN